MAGDDVDAIIVGSGLGGLTAGAALAEAGLRVLVLERLANIGGAATIYRHGKLTVEGSLHETDGATILSDDGPIRRLGLEDAVVGVPTDVFYQVRGGPLSEPVVVPHGLAAARVALTKNFPKASKTLYDYFERLDALRSFAGDRSDRAGKWPRLAGLAREAPRTLSQSFARHLGDHEALKCAIGAPLVYFDDDPNKLSALFYQSVWAIYVETGSYYIKGGSQALSMALARKIRSAGGEIRTQTTVVKVLTNDDGAVCGVVADNKQGNRETFLAGTVIGNAAPAALAGLMDDDAQKKVLGRDARYEASTSLFVVSLGLREPAHHYGVEAFSTFLYPQGFDEFARYADAAAVFGSDPMGRMPPYVVADYGRLETGLHREGDLHLITLTGIDRLSWWDGLSEDQERVRRARWIDALIKDLDRHFPRIAGAVVQSEIATSRTMHNRLGTPEGEVYGYRPTPRRYFSRPPGPMSPVKGLYYGSAYTLAGGYAGAMRGGLMAADTVLEKRRRMRR